jgi:hypothetical protein
MKFIALAISCLLIFSMPANANDAANFNAMVALANKGDAEAQYHVGMMYNNGIGTQKDPRQAFEFRPFRNGPPDLGGMGPTRQGWLARPSVRMSAFGPKQTWPSALHMSAIGGKADMPFCGANVRFFDPSANAALGLPGSPY